ncbi:MAG: oligosaccharide flippase family protein [Bacteroidota bacterium]
MVTKQTIRQNISWLVAVNLISKPLWFFFLLVSARVLGPAEFGKYMLAISFISVAVGIFEGGIDIHLIRTLASEPKRYFTFFSQTTWIKVGSGIIASIAAYALSLFIPSLVTDYNLFFAAVIFGITSAALTHFRFVFRAYEIMQYEAWSIVVEKISVILFCGIALLFFPTAFSYGFSFAIAYLLASLVTLLLVFKKVGKPAFIPEFRNLVSEIIKPALPFATMNIFIIVYLRSGTLLLAIITQNDQLIGYFNAGYRIVEAFVLIPSMIIAPIYPVFARRINDKEVVSRLAMDALRIILSMAMLISVPIFILHDEVTLLLFGDFYKDASSSVGILCLAMIPIGINWVVGSLVAVSGRQSRANVYILGTTIGNVLLLVILIPILGVVGAAISVVITECAVTFSNWTLVRDYIRTRALLSVLLKVSASAIAVYILGLFTVSLPFIVRLTLVVVCMVGGFFLLRLITIQDLITAFREKLS